MMQSYGDLLDSSWAFFKNNWGLFAVLALILGVFSAAITFYDPTTGVPLEDREAISLTEYLSPPVLISFAVLIIVSVLVGLGAVSFIYFGLTKEPKQYQEAFQYAMDRFVPWFFTNIMVVFFLALLFLLLIVPGIIFMVFWVFVPFVVLFRDKSGIEALKYSKHLVTNNWWRTVGYMILTSLIVGVIGFFMGLPLAGVLIYSYLSGGSFVLEMFISFVQASLGSFLDFFTVVFLVAFFLALEKEKAEDKTPENV